MDGLRRAPLRAAQASAPWRKTFLDPHVKKVPVSFLIPIRNEEANLPRCLGAISWADEIFVVDSYSMDASAAIAQEYGAKVVQFDFVPPWPKKKNWALENLPFRNEWVFILDADEVLSPNADAEINAIV